jgi:hypothetical protein
LPLPFAGVVALGFLDTEAAAGVGAEAATAGVAPWALLWGDGSHNGKDESSM